MVWQPKYYKEEIIWHRNQMTILVYHILDGIVSIILYLKCIFNNISLCEFHQGKLLLHLTIPFEEKPKTNLPSDNLKYYRQRKQITTRQLAEKLDIVPLTVVMYENGKYPIPYDVAIKLTDVLEIEVSFTETLKSVRTALGLSQKAFVERIGIVYQATTIKSKKAIADRHERFIRRYMLRLKRPVYKLHF